jgi:hypothetical protein
MSVMLERNVVSVGDLLDAHADGGGHRTHESGTGMACAAVRGLWSLMVANVTPTRLLERQPTVPFLRRVAREAAQRVVSLMGERVLGRCGNKEGKQLNGSGRLGA